MGYAAGVSLVEYLWDSPTKRRDPYGLQAPPVYGPQPGPDLWGELFPNEDVSQGCPCRDLMTPSSAETESVYNAIVALCDCRKCDSCTDDECRREAHAIAQAYVQMFWNHRTIRCRLSPTRWFDYDYRAGWLCYQWQTHTYNGLLPVVSRSNCFRMERVGSIESGPDDQKLTHNWVAITLKGTSGFYVRPGACTVYLDPWWRSSPCAYQSVGPGHCAHNCQMVFPGQGWLPGQRCTLPTYEFIDGRGGMEVKWPWLPWD